jgi:hypothetical protein
MASRERTQGERYLQYLEYPRMSRMCHRDCCPEMSVPHDGDALVNQDL